MPNIATKLLKKLKNNRKIINQNMYYYRFETKKNPKKLFFNNRSYSQKILLLHLWEILLIFKLYCVGDIPNIAFKLQHRNTNMKFICHHMRKIHFFAVKNLYNIAPYFFLLFCHWQPKDIPRCSDLNPFFLECRIRICFYIDFLEDRMRIRFIWRVNSDLRFL